jgi:hypothetical protein
MNRSLWILATIALLQDMQGWNLPLMDWDSPHKVARQGNPYLRPVLSDAFRLWVRSGDSEH